MRCRSCGHVERGGGRSGVGPRGGLQDQKQRRQAPWAARRCRFRAQTAAHRTADASKVMLKVARCLLPTLPARARPKPHATQPTSTSVSGVCGGPRGEAGPGAVGERRSRSAAAAAAAATTASGATQGLVSGVRSSSMECAKKQILRGHLEPSEQSWVRYLNGGRVAGWWVLAGEGCGRGSGWGVRRHSSFLLEPLLPRQASLTQAKC